MADDATHQVQNEAMPTIDYDTDRFDEAVASLPPPSEMPGGTTIVFLRGVREERQQALARLTRRTTATVHQFRLPTMLGDRRMQTQNSLRKAFDHAAEEGAMLYFDAVDELFAHVHEEGLDLVDDAEPTTVEYFFERVDAYPNTAVVCLQNPDHLDLARRYPIDLVVSFE